MKSVFGALGVGANLVLGLYLMALGLLGLISGGEMFVPLVPVAPESAAMAVLGAGIFAAAASVLSIGGGRWRSLPLLIWSIGLFVNIVAAVFRGNYKFDGIESFTTHAWMVLGALILLIASYLRFKAPEKRSIRY